MAYENLNPQKALIWRIVHLNNLPWILAKGLHCRNSPMRDPGFVTIGNEELINRRAHRIVPLPPGGTLANYVPFYFTPFSPMLYNIHTGHGGIRKHANEEIVILVSSVHKVRELGIPIIFTDRHAYPPLSRYFSDVARLDQVDWPLLQQRDFRRDEDDPEKVERYQAEALVHRHLPVAALLGAICYSDAVKRSIDPQVANAGFALAVRSIPEWYFQ